MRYPKEWKSIRLTEEEVEKISLCDWSRYNGKMAQVVAIHTETIWVYAPEKP